MVAVLQVLVVSQQVVDLSFQKVVQHLVCHQHIPQNDIFGIHYIIRFHTEQFISSFFPLHFKSLMLLQVFNP